MKVTGSLSLFRWLILATSILLFRYAWIVTTNDLLGNDLGIEDGSPFGNPSNRTKTITTTTKATKTDGSTIDFLKHDQATAPSEAFGACLMMKEDNDLLYEWIAYHYTTLPLRYLVIGSDQGNTQNPEDVLKRWNHTGLKYWVVRDFAARHGPSKRVKSEKEDEDFHHHQFIYRQRGFITTCAEMLKEKGIKWTAYIDSDEFLVLNLFVPGELQLLDASKENKTKTYYWRKAMTDALGSYPSSTVLDVIQSIGDEVELVPPCVTMPRLRFGALENLTCQDANSVTMLAKQEYNYRAMSTLRYKQHGGTNNWKANKFAKVIVDLSRISDVTLVPKNVHRPFRNECGYPAVHFKDAIFTLNHYTASWERYSHRVDPRRSCERWMEMAFYDEGNSCHQHLHKWFPRFVQLVGKDQARYLLGVDETTRVTAVTEVCPPENK